MFIRFITEFKNEHDEIETGVFQAVGYLCRSNVMYDYDKKYLMEIRDWFDLNLEKPKKLSKSLKTNAPKVALSWFRSTATEHLSKMYEMKEVIERYGIVITTIKRENAGYVVYEDKFQVSTIPHGKDKSVTK